MSNHQDCRNYKQQPVMEFMRLQVKTHRLDESGGLDMRIYSPVSELYCVFSHWCKIYDIPEISVGDFIMKITSLTGMHPLVEIGDLGPVFYGMSVWCIPAGSSPEV